MTFDPTLPLVDVLLLEGVTLTQDAQQLNGSERAVLDGLLTPAECGVLLQLAKVRWCVVQPPIPLLLAYVRPVFYLPPPLSLSF